MELIEKIKQYLRDEFCVEYTGKLQLRMEDDGDGYTFYTLDWPLNPDDIGNPMRLAGQFINDDKFFDYIKKEIKDKRFFLYKNFRVIKVPKPDNRNDRL